MIRPSDVTTALMKRINEGKYEIHGAMPTLDELNAEFFGDGAGPKPGRTAYAPLIAAGMVEARQGRGGGHFLVSATPITATNAFDAIAGEIRALGDRVAALRDHLMCVVEFEHIPTGEYFGECLHPSRLAAEAYAIDMLVRLGEPRDQAERAVEFAGWTCADVRPGGYGVRIYGYTLGGEHVDIHGRACLKP